ncbi:MAG: DNA polymerase III subunit gamma/tau [Pseudohongiellaceae bacterium]
MTYQVLARKWRPRNFKEMAGQGHVLKPLVNALDNDRLHHAYLFTGTRGVGKTTIARILAKCLNCEQGIGSTPCDACSACTEINEGRFIDLIEVDAASRTKVEDTRELLENVQYAPSVGRYKVYLIDEVHMLSNHSFNALLKTLEEPPPHIKFLLATTDPQKLPITILSRCLQFNLKNLGPQLVADYLNDVLVKENITHEDAAVWQIATAAAGSMRDALTLTDQAISFCDGELKASGVIDMLGTPDPKVVYDLLAGLKNHNAEQLLQVIDEVSQRTPDFGQLLEGLLSALHRVAIAQVLGEAVDNSFGDREQVLEYAAAVSAEDVQLYYQMALKGKGDLAASLNQKSAFEMLMIRMLLFAPAAVDTGAVPVPVSKPEIEKKKKPVAPEPVAGYTSTAASALERPEPAMRPTAPPAHQQPKVESVTAEAASKASLEQLNGERWRGLYPRLNVAGLAGNILANCVFEQIEGKKLSFILDEAQSVIYGDEHRRRIEEVLSTFFGTSLSVEITIGKPLDESPAALRQRLTREAHERRVSDFEQDGNVREIIEHFSATISRESITPQANEVE